jgi:hypothetical protein
MFRRSLVLGVFVMLSTGFSFAANDANILYCNLEEFSIQDDPTKGLDTFHCEDKD